MTSAYVICIKDNVQSMQAAERCKQSGNKYGFPISEYHAWTPTWMRFTLEQKTVPQHS